MKLDIDEEPLRMESDDRLDFEVERDPGFGDVAAKIGTRNLMIAIITMPFVFLLVVMSILAVFGGKSDDDLVASAAQSASPSAVRSTPIASDDLQLQEPALRPINASANGAVTVPQGGTANLMALDGDRLAVRVTSEAGDVIVVYDLAQGEILYRIPVAVLAE